MGKMVGNWPGLQLFLALLKFVLHKIFDLWNEINILCTYCTYICKVDAAIINPFATHQHNM